MKYKIGDKVWVYECPLKPRLATIVEKMDLVDAYKVEHKEGRDKVRTYGIYSIFKYPDDIQNLIGAMKDDINIIDRHVMYFEEFSFDFENPNNPIGWHE